MERQINFSRHLAGEEWIFDSLFLLVTYMNINPELKSLSNPCLQRVKPTELNQGLISTLGCSIRQSRFRGKINLLHKLMGNRCQLYPSGFYPHRLFPIQEKKTYVSFGFTIQKDSGTQVKYQMLWQIHRCMRPFVFLSPFLTSRSDFFFLPNCKICGLHNLPVTVFCLVTNDENPLSLSTIHMHGLTSAILDFLQSS